MKETLQYLQNLMNQAGLSGIAGYFPVVIALLGAMPFLGRLGIKLLKLRQQRKLSKDLHPFYTPLEIQKATQNYVETKCQNIAPSKEEEPGKTNAFATKEKIIPFFLKKAFKPNRDDCRFYIVLADSGMGKTTFLINLYLRYIGQFFGARYQIRLLPLGSPDIDKEIEKIPDNEKHKTILLLDAFDEDRIAVHGYKTRLNDLVQMVSHFRKVVITCCTKLFPSEEEPQKTGVLGFGPEGDSHVFRKLYLSPFDDKDISTYLRKRFSFYHFLKKRKAKRIVRNSPNLMIRPILLSNIEDLLQSRQSYEATYTIYDELIRRWILREVKKLPADRREQYEKKGLYEFLSAIAIDIYRHREERGGLFINSEAIKPFADEHHIALEDMEMESRSLLNRNARGEYKFSHRLVLEYFLAMESFSNKAFRKKMNFGCMDQAEAFFEELIWEKWTVPFFSRRDLQGKYSVEDGKQQDLARITVKLLPKITFLKFTTWKTSDDVLLLRVLKNLKRLDFIETKVISRQRTELKHILPNCTINFLPFLRNTPLTVSKSDAQKVFGLDKGKRPMEYIQNQFEDLDDVVLDHTTGLIWQKSGSTQYMQYNEAHKYINGLNSKRFAGYNDWRLPTLPELMSLLEPEKQSNGLFINPIFDKRQSWCWSADKFSSGSAWLVYFSHGKVNWYNLSDSLYVRVVRS